MVVPQKTVLLIGAGRMGGAMLRGWMLGLGPEYTIYALDPHAGPHVADIPLNAPSQPRFRHILAPEDLPEGQIIDAVVLAVKPQMVVSALGAILPSLQSGTLIISLAAGVTISTIKTVIPGHQPVIRVMPNIGAAIGKSTTAGFAPDTMPPAYLRLAEHLFGAVGVLIWLQLEDDFHIATAVCGSGPAFFFAVCEAMIAAAIENGLSAERANSMVIGTIISTSSLLQQNPEPATLRENVTSPNGTTAAGLDILTENKVLEHVIGETVNAACERSRSLA